LRGEFFIFEDKKRKANGAHEAINHFVRNVGKCSPILIFFSPGN